MEELVKYMRALVLLGLAGRQDGQEKSELLLVRAGFRVKDVAELLGKSEAAVAKAVSRARDAAKKETLTDE